jgi:hypothetical protein
MKKASNTMISGNNSLSAEYLVDEKYSNYKTTRPYTCIIPGCRKRTEVKSGEIHYHPPKKVDS